MTEATVQSVRETLQIARMACLNLEEDVEGLDFALSLPPKEMVSLLSVEDITFIHSLIPAFLR